MTDNTQDRSIIIERTFDAPLEMMFSLLTEKEHMVNWFGPKGTHLSFLEIDATPGGVCRYAMQGPDGGELWGKLTYKEITPPNRLVYTVSFTDPDGNFIRHPFEPNWPLEMLTINELIENEGKTTIRATVSPHNAGEIEHETFAKGEQGFRFGTKGMYDQLDEYIESLK